MTAWIIILSLFYLYLSHRKIVGEFSKVIRRFGGGNRAFIWLWSLIFLPGTILHEISHFLVAAATGAKTGKVEILPENLEKGWEKEEKSGGFVLGYVQTQNLNPISGFLTGIAPFVFGLAFLIWLASSLRSGFGGDITLMTVLQVYLFFTIANSSFPSWSDIKQTLSLVVIVLVALAAAFIFGIQLQFTKTHPQIIVLVDALSFALLISVILNTVIVVVIMMINRAFKRH